jgi:hypothetical protein
MTKRHPYTCPRCGYFTSKKSNMNSHLHDLKKPCPAIEVDIELTDAIKQYVLDNRIYRIPKPPKQPKEPKQHQVISQHIHYNNIIVNYINNMDFQDKLTQFLEYTNDELANCSDIVESKCIDRKAELRDGNFCKERALNLDSVIEVLNECTSNKNINKMNITYDKVLKTLHIYDEDEWNGHIFELGVKEIIKTIQDAYLDTYEEYLLEQYVSSSLYHKQCIKEALKDYYEFLECFDSTPILVTGKDDLVMDSREGDIGKLYKSVNVSASKRNEIKKLVYNVIKTNCNANVIELNKQMMELIKMDEQFKHKILDELTLNAL